MRLVPAGPVFLKTGHLTPGILERMAESCLSCGAPASDSDRFCGRCGAQLGQPTRTATQGFCTVCGARLVSGDRFCSRCGTAVGPSLGDEVPVAPDDDDFMAGWDDLPAAYLDDLPLIPVTEEAVTETIATQRQGGDTAVITPVPSPLDSPDQESPAPAPSPPSAEPERPLGANSFPLGATIALIGAVAVIASSILVWRGPFDGQFPKDIPAAAILDPDATGGLNLGVVLLGIGTLGALFALLTMAVPFLKFVRRLIGLVTLLIPVGFVLRTADPLLADGRLGELPSALGIGVYVAAAGAVTQMVAGRWFRR